MATVDVQFDNPGNYFEKVLDADLIPRQGDYIHHWGKSYLVHNVVWMYEDDDNEPVVRLVLR